MFFDITWLLYFTIKSIGVCMKKVKIVLIGCFLVVSGFVLGSQPGDAHGAHGSQAQQPMQSLAELCSRLRAEYGTDRVMVHLVLRLPPSNNTTNTVGALPSTENSNKADDN